ncbi:efflux RND transporter periplasmic adaptor subunit [Ruficoccus amylovorans]|uniref:Efflux RND transporter periplasmic adaptor subunit n=1 Tax=Ruficoccus amylovorans TaxID=1804625 RepID=A0A842HGN8_9BACT|nr:efflux RND transporter periplasmic adaptor subunit [Ruficoccus amylovorans]MBC2594786.1 efflux RND transporter periplasmic adaptor subunit [Ruficoccus amylovorans]
MNLLLKSWLCRVGVVGSLASLSFMLAGCGEKPQQDQKSHARTVTAATVEAKDVPLYYDTLGKITSLESVNIVSQVNGQIMEIHFEQGSTVEEGDLLYTIYQPPYEAAVTQAKGRLQQSIAALEIARLEVERNRPLVPQKLVAEQSFEQMEANVIQLEGQVEENTGALEAAQVNLNYCTITAPVSGMIGIYQVNQGNVVYASANQQLTTIQQMDPIYVDFIVPTTVFPQVQKYYDEAEGNLKILVSYLDGEDDSDNKLSREADLTILGNLVAANTGTVNLRATMKNADYAFWPNQPIAVRIILKTLKDALVVPEGAVAYGQQGTYAFVIKSDNTVEQRTISVGQLQENGTMVVKSGLSAGERVVVEGQVFLMPGNEVIVTSDNPKENRLPKATTDKVIGILKKYNKGSPELFKQIEETGQLPPDLVENLKKHGALSEKEAAFIEQLEGYGDDGKGPTGQSSGSSATPKKAAE